MNSRLSKLTILATIMLGSSLGIGPAVASPHSAVSTITTRARTTYVPESQQAQAVFAWIRRQSPEYAPMVVGDQITVVIEAQSSGSMVAMPLGSNPPVGLPSNGQPGDVVTITQTRANGDRESWSYTFANTGGSAPGGTYPWVLSAYEYKKGNLSVQ